MKVNIEKEKLTKDFEAGDIVVVENTPYIAMKIHPESFKSPVRFALRGFDGQTASTGYHDTISALRSSLAGLKFKVYPADDYELKLVRK